MRNWHYWQGCLLNITSLSWSTVKTYLCRDFFSPLLFQIKLHFWPTKSWNGAARAGNVRLQLPLHNSNGTCLECWNFIYVDWCLTVRDMFWLDIPNLIFKDSWCVPPFAIVFQVSWHQLGLRTHPAHSCCLSHCNSPSTKTLPICGWTWSAKSRLVASSRSSSRSSLNGDTCWGFVSFQTSYWWTPGAS